MPADPLAAIDHVVVLMLENRSFDHVLGGLVAADPTVPGDVDVVPPGATDRGAPIAATDATWRLTDDPGHDQVDFLRQRAIGFTAAFAEKYGAHASLDDRANVAGVCRLDQLPVLRDLARAYAVADRWFAPVAGPTWPNRWFAISGTSRGTITMPDGVAGAFGGRGRYFGMDQPTIFHRLRDARLPWKVYYGDVPQVLTLRSVRDIAGFSTFGHLAEFERDARRGTLPAFAWIEPEYFFLGANDCHPPRSVAMGEPLVRRVHDAVRASPAWAKTLLVVVFDEWGGFHDHVDARTAIAPSGMDVETIRLADGSTRPAAFDVTGFRVPAIVISPLARRGALADKSTTFDHTAILRTVCQRFGLPPLTERDAHAPTLAPFLDLGAASAARRHAFGAPAPRALEPMWMAARAHADAKAPAARRRAAPRPLNQHDRALLALTDVLSEETGLAPLHEERLLMAHAELGHDALAAGTAVLARERVQRFLASKS